MDDLAGARQYADHRNRDARLNPQNRYDTRNTIHYARCDSANTAIPPPIATTKPPCTPWRICSRWSLFLRPLAPFLIADPYSAEALRSAAPLRTVLPLTAAICYVIILGEQVRDNFRPDTDYLLTISNDAWFGKSIGPVAALPDGANALWSWRPLLR